MLVKVRDILANPHRDLAEFPFEEAKITALIESIEETGFWDNLVGRVVPEGVQIAYGHHRVEALRRLDPEATIDVAIQTIDDGMMLRMMARENAEVYRGSARNDIELVWATIKGIAEGSVVLAEVTDPRTKRQYLDDVGNYGFDVRARCSHIFTAAQIASFLGWNGQKAKNALGALRAWKVDGIVDKSSIVRPGVTPGAVRKMTTAARRMTSTAAARNKDAEDKVTKATADALEAANAAIDAERAAERDRSAKTTKAAKAAAKAAEEAEKARAVAEARAAEAAEALEASKADARRTIEAVSREAEQTGEAPKIHVPRPREVIDLEKAADNLRKRIARRFEEDGDTPFWKGYAEIRPHLRHLASKERDGLVGTLRVIQTRIDDIITELKTTVDTAMPTDNMPADLPALEG